jgi:hypothetical protein
MLVLFETVCFGPTTMCPERLHEPEQFRTPLNDTFPVSKSKLLPRLRTLKIHRIQISYAQKSPN